MKPIGHSVLRYRHTQTHSRNNRRFRTSIAILQLKGIQELVLIRKPDNNQSFQPLPFLHTILATISFPKGRLWPATVVARYRPETDVQAMVYSVAPSHICRSLSHLPPRSKQLSIRTSSRNHRPTATINASTNAPSRRLLVFIRIGR